MKTSQKKNQNFGQMSEKGLSASLGTMTGAEAVRCIRPPWGAEGA